MASEIGPKEPPKPPPPPPKIEPKVDVQAAADKGAAAVDAAAKKPNPAIEAARNTDAFEASQAMQSLDKKAEVPAAGPKADEGFLNDLYKGGAANGAANDVANDAKVDPAQAAAAKAASDPAKAPPASGADATNARHGYQAGTARPSGPARGMPAAPTVTTGPDGKTTVQLPDGQNHVKVHQNPDGSMRVDQHRDPTMSGKPVRSTTIPADKAKDVTINGGKGDDHIEMADSVTKDMTINGGAGNDKLTGGKGNDTINGGDGDDHIDGRDGNDKIDGGNGDDHLFGGKGNDDLKGGDGRDWMHGGDGDDKIDGGHGNDQLFGGKGNDVVTGGNGDDAIAGGEGDDTVDGGAGKDKVFVEGNDKVADDKADTRVNMASRIGADGKPIGHSIKVQGSDKFKDRMAADLDALASTPEGRDLLGRMDATGRTFPLKEDKNPDPRVEPRGNDRDGFLRPDGRPGKGVNSTITMYDGSLPTGEGMTPSAIILGHELAHSLDMATGTMAPGGSRNPSPQGGMIADGELAAVGLPYGRGPRALRTPARPSENSLRREVGLPERRWY